MRRAAKRDANEAEIVQALVQAGCSVSKIDSEDGVPDLLIGRAGVNYLLEVKDDDQPPCKRTLTPRQVKWHWHWKGQKAVVETIEEALEAVGL